MNKYEVRYTQLFRDDFEEIIYYIANILKNEIAANNLILKVNKAIERRSYNPENYEKHTLSRNVFYKIYVNNYTIFYTVNKNIMEIRRMIYSRRNFIKLI